MHSFRTMLTVGALAAVLVVAVPGAAAAAPSKIGPNQHFAGFVNGQSSDATIYVVCSGPSGQTGHVAGGQTLSVRKAACGPGFTGPFSQIYAWVVPPPGGPPPTQVTFTRYGTMGMPTSLTVPCGGTGKVEFSSCPYLAPCADGWVPAYVDVTFNNIAA
jgi:hypothetical protein